MLISMIMSGTSVFAQSVCEHPQILKKLHEEIPFVVEKSLTNYLSDRQKQFNLFAESYFEQNNAVILAWIRSGQYSREVLLQKINKRMENIFAEADLAFIASMQKQKMWPGSTGFQYQKKYEKLLAPYIAHTLSQQQKAMMDELAGQEDALLNTLFRIDPYEEQLLEKIIQNSFKFQFAEIKKLHTRKMTDGELHDCQTRLTLNSNASAMIEYTVGGTADDSEVFLSPIDFYFNGEKMLDPDMLGRYLINITVK